MSDQDQIQPEETKPPGLKDLFKIPDFRYLYGGQVVSNFGDAMTNLALLLLVNALTGSVTALATMAIMLAIPSLTFGLIAGVYVDRLDRKKIMIFSDLFRAIFVLGFLLVDSAEKVWILYLIGFMQSSIATFFNPARGALLPNIIGKDKLLAANSISQTSQIIFGLLGTGVAGLFIGLFDGYREIFLIDAASFFLSLILISRIKYTAQSASADEDVSVEMIFSQLKEGLVLTFNNRI